MMAGPQHSKLVAARLRAGAFRQASVHPDADLLSAFTEGCLDEAERGKVLDHLAECTVCRDVVYLSRPEEETAVVQPVKARSRAHWIAWGGLRWAALAASMSIVVAIAILVRTNPERQPATLSTFEKQAAQQGTGQPRSSASESHASASSPAAQAGEKTADKESGTPKLSESPHGAMADSSLVANRHGFSRDEKDLGLRSPSDAGKLERVREGSNKEAAKQPSSSDLGRRGIAGGMISAPGNAGSSEEKGRLFDLRQQQRNQAGPYANINTSNSAQNQSYPPPDSQGYVASVPASPPAAARPDKNGSYPEATQQASAKPNTQLADAVAKKKAAPEQGVVPAEEARRKNLETIPAPAPAQSKEETVAAAGQLQSYDRVTRASTGASVVTEKSAQPSIQKAKIDDLHTDNTAMNTLALSPGVVPSSAITGWRVHRGRVQERLYGIWHNVVVGGEERFKSSSGEVLSSAPAPVMTQLRFAAVTAVRTAVWAVQAIGRQQSYIVVHHSRDNGVTWQASALTSEKGLNPSAQISISFKDAMQGELGLSTGEKWQTIDGGVHWTSVK